MGILNKILFVFISWVVIGVVAQIFAVLWYVHKIAKILGLGEGANLCVDIIKDDDSSIVDDYENRSWESLLMKALDGIFSGCVLWPDSLAGIVNAGNYLLSEAESRKKHTL